MCVNKEDMDLILSLIRVLLPNTPTEKSEELNSSLKEDSQCLKTD